MKKANKKQVNNQQVNNNGCQHVQLGGIAYYDDKQYFLFSPDSVNQGVVEAFRRHGVAQQMQDGTFSVEQDQGWGYSAHAEGVLP